MGKSSQEYVATRLNRKSFRHMGDVHIQGDVQVEGPLVVAGNLQVDGDLQAEDIFCFGKMDVKGNVRTGHCIAAVSISAAGFIDAATLETGRNADYIANLAALPQQAQDDPRDYFDTHVREGFIDDLEEMQEECRHSLFPAVYTAKHLDVYTMEIEGDVLVDGYIDLDTGTVNGHVQARCIVLEDDMIINGSLHVTKDITGGDLEAYEINCRGNLRIDSANASGDLAVIGSIKAGMLQAGDNIQAGGSITAYSEITAGNYIKAGEFIASAGQITTGSDYGVLAGLCVQRSQWQEKGYVLSPVASANVLTGHVVQVLSSEAIEERVDDLMTDDFESPGE